MNTAITTKGSWHTAVVSERSAATGTTYTFRITWRTQQWECCGGQSPIRFDAEHLPFWVDGSYATVQDRTQQCGRCGRQHTANYNVKEV